MEVFVNLHKNLRNNKITDLKINQIIQNYSFFFNPAIGELANNQMITNNFKKSKAILANQYTSKNQSDIFIIIGFKNTIIIISKSLLSNYFSLFFDHPDLPIYFLSKSEQNFDENITNKKFDCDKIFLDHISKFNEAIESVTRNKLDKSAYELWKFILPCITGYLIKQSYAKIKEKQASISFSQNDDFNNLKDYTEYSKNDYIELGLIEIGSLLRVELIYLIQKEEICVKKMPHLDSIDCAKLIKREKNNYSKINFPYISKMYGTGKNDNDEYLIIQYIYGNTLMNIEKINLSFDEKIKIIFDIMMIIHYLNNKNFVYRDLKPDNVIIDDNKNVFLIDFDRMLTINSETNEPDDVKTIIFDTIFIAPEVNNKKISYKNDIYSIGKMIFYIINEEDLNKQKHEISSKIHQIIDWCTKINPEERPTISVLIKEFYLFFKSQIKLSTTQISNIVKYYKENNQSIFYLTLLNSEIDETLAFKNITKQCYEYCKMLQKLYSKFEFQLFHYSNQEHINNYLQNYLKQFKFITYYISKFPISFIQDENRNISISYAIVCVENKCIIIENIDDSSIDLILDTFNSSIININQKTSENENVFEEIESFCQLFNISENVGNNYEFIYYSLRVLTCYTVRRFFYPTIFFKNPSFFNFDGYSNPLDEYIHSNLKKIILTENEDDMIAQLKSFRNEITEKVNDDKLQNNYKPKIYEFNKNEFHNLRILNTDSDASVNLAVYIKNFYVFIVKIIDPKKIDVFKDEINFNLNYSHRCFTRFYGFIKDNNEITGFVYEFMCNGNLLKENKASNLYPFMTTIRLFQGLKYLYSNKLTHTNLKPTSILFNHDYIPYISGFETIKFFNDNFKEKSTEQISYSTDIYSFGSIIYYLFENTKMQNMDKSDDQNKEELLMKNSSSTIQYIYHSSVKHNENDRISLNDIEKEIGKEIVSFLYFENFLTKENTTEKIIELIQYFQECILFQVKSKDYFKNSIKKLLHKSLFSLFRVQNDQSNLLCKLGDIYYDGKLVKENYLKYPLLSNNTCL